MNPRVARTLKQYASVIVPDVAKRQFRYMEDRAYQFLKKVWHELSHREKGRFRRIAEAGRPLPERIKQLARDRGLVVEWPIPMKKGEPKKRHRDWGKPNSWRHKQYGRRLR